MIEKFSYISKDYIAQFLPTNPIIVEAGGNKGRDTIEFKKKWPNAIIHVFEPVPALYKQLKEQTEQHKNIFCYPYALSNATGFAKFQLSEQVNSISSLLEPHLIKQEKPNIKFIEKTVQTISLNDWAHKYGVTHIDLLWLDVQGAELAVLQGASNLLSNIYAIHCEVALNQRYKNQPLYRDTENFLQEYGFNVMAEALYRKNWGNALFINKSLGRQ